jgi:putative thioredoxin
MSTSPFIFDVAEADFASLVLEASRGQPVVVDFWAPWCQPCLMLGPVLERLVEQREGQVLLAKVNVDEAPALAEHFEIASIPAVKAFRDGHVVLEFTGVLPERHLNAFLDQVCAQTGAEAKDEARALEESDPAAAEKAYREALARDDRSDPARLGLARVLLSQNRLDEIADLLAPLAAEGETGEEAQRLTAKVDLRRRAALLGDEAAARRKLAAQPDSAAARLELGTVLAASGQYQAALEMLMAAAERDPKLAAKEVREVMVQVFYALGTDHELANDYRTRLARLLY